MITVSKGNATFNLRDKNQLDAFIGCGWSVVQSAKPIADIVVVEKPPVKPEEKPEEKPTEKPAEKPKATPKAKPKTQAKPKTTTTRKRATTTRKAQT